MTDAIIYLATSFWIGAVHAATPGHGKTIAAAYIVGARGKPVDAVILGVFVTLSHTSGIVLVGILASLGLPGMMPQRVEAWMALVTGLLVVLIAPVLALQFDLHQPLLGTLTLSLLLGTPVLSMIGAIGAALTLGLRGGGALLSLLVLPLYVPVLIIGAGSVDMAAAGLGAEAHFLLLAALLVVAAAFAPWAVAAALRISAE